MAKNNKTHTIRRQNLCHKAPKVCTARSKFFFLKNGRPIIVSQKSRPKRSAAKVGRKSQPKESAKKVSQKKLAEKSRLKRVGKKNSAKKVAIKGSKNAVRKVGKKFIPELVLLLS
jgi:hypothetical protein